MKFNILTIFPNMYAPIEESILKRATKKGKISINLIDIRKYSENKHNHVDDTPYGGGAGMVMRADVLKRALESINGYKDKHVIYLSPKGNVLNQEKVKKLSKLKDIILIAGHYEGIDQRFIDLYVDEEISIGDYVLTGGELPSMVLVDSIARHVEGVISKESLEDESFENYLLEYPQYTKPNIFEGISVPDVLVSGNHQNIEKYRREKSLEETYNKRKDLIEKATKQNKLTKEDIKYLEKLEIENKERKGNGRN